MISIKKVEEYYNKEVEYRTISRYLNKKKSIRIY